MTRTALSSLRNESESDRVQKSLVHRSDDVTSYTAIFSLVNYFCENIRNWKWIDGNFHTDLLINAFWVFILLLKILSRKDIDFNLLFSYCSNDGLSFLKFQLTSRYARPTVSCEQHFLYNRPHTKVIQELCVQFSKSSIKFLKFFSS